MYPNLYFLVEKLTGISLPLGFRVVQTFGLFLALTFIVSGIIMTREIKRREGLGQFKPQVKKSKGGGDVSIGDTILNAIIGFILGFKILYIIRNSEEFFDNAADIVLSTTGDILGGIIGALALGGFKAYELYKSGKEGKEPKQIMIAPHEMVGDIIIVAAISGLIGAKIFALAETPDEFFKDPIGQLLSGSGLAIYGGLIVAFFTVFFYVKRRGLNPVHMMDATAPVLLLGYGIGRMGCHLSGDGDWGIINTSPKPFSWMPDWLWSMKYTNNVLGRGANTQDANGNLIGSVKVDDCPYAEDFPQYCYELSEGVYPTSVYEIIIMVIAFLVFWFILRKRIKVAGVLFFIYMIINGMERFWIETFRVNQRYDWFFDFTQAQIIATCMMVIGVAGVVIATMRHRNKSGDDGGVVA